MPCGAGAGSNDAGTSDRTSAVCSSLAAMPSSRTKQRLLAET